MTNIINCHALRMSCALLVGLSISTSYAANREVHLRVAYQTIQVTKQPAKAIVVNGQTPGPVLHFREGDHVVIHVHNDLDRETAIHWHGLLLPWHMDGVAHVTQAPIPPGGDFRYEYTLKQSGTYWYHAHADLQEQQGLYGAYIIDPIRPAPYHYNRDFVMLLSDWSNTNPDDIYANLKRDGDYYASEFPLQPSLLKYWQSYREAKAPAARQTLRETYSMMQSMRMSPYDFSDVAYDAYLLNGHPAARPWIAQVNRGDTVRLRFIGASGSTIFHVKIPGAHMRMVQVDGNDIVPYDVDDFSITPGETFDVLVKIEQARPYIIYAESNDTRGRALGALITASAQHPDFANVEPFSEPKPIQMMSHEHMHMGMPMDMHIPTDAGKYKQVKSLRNTAWSEKPIQTIHMSLSGWMDTYIWYLNGLPEYRAKPILIEPGKRYRFVFENQTMMHHPMHLHGHWMILRNGHGAYDPKLHTIDVPPNATITADFEADANSGLWYFHCHNLFHMKAGMANIVRYQNTPDDDLPMEHDGYMHDGFVTAHPARWYQGRYLDVAADPFDTYYQVTFKYLLGPDFDKLELFMNDAEMKRGAVENADLDVFYRHLFTQFWAVKGGVNYFYRPAKTPYFQPGLGLEGLAPYFIDTDLRAYYHAGSLKLDLELTRDTQITNNGFIRLSVRGIGASKTVSKDQIGSGLNEIQFTLMPYYRLMPGLSIFAQYERDQYYGVANQLVRADDDSVMSNTLSAGFSVVF